VTVFDKSFCLKLVHLVLAIGFVVGRTLASCPGVVSELSYLTDLGLISNPECIRSLEWAGVEVFGGEEMNLSFKAEVEDIFRSLSIPEEWPISRAGCYVSVCLGFSSLSFN
jgi:hypothetical protein